MDSKDLRRVGADHRKPPIPSLKWPLIWLATSGYLVLASFIDATIDREEDAAAALTILPIFVATFIAALWFYRKRVEERKQWRQEREFDWVLKVPELPPLTDWEAFESDIEYRVGGGWHNSRSFDPNDPRTLGLAKGGRVGWKR